MGELFSVITAGLAGVHAEAAKYVSIDA